MICKCYIMKWNEKKVKWNIYFRVYTLYNTIYRNKYNNKKTRNENNKFIKKNLNQNWNLFNKIKMKIPYVIINYIKTFIYKKNW